MRKIILRCGLSPGDIVMLTAAVRDLHLCYPGQFLTDVRTSCPDLWLNNPHITPMKEEEPGVEALDCSYPLINRCNTTPHHCLHGFIEFLNHHLGLKITPTVFRGDIHLSEQEKAWYSQVHELTRREIPFWIIAAGGKYDVTIKWWDSRRYQEVVDHFRGRTQFVQVGGLGHHHPRLEGVIDLRGQTSLRELVRLVYHAEGVLCPVTALMHLAAAVERPRGPGSHRACVVIAGGREPAHWEAYPGHQFIHTNGALPCCLDGGCWRDRVAPLRDGDRRDHPAHRCVDVVDGLPRCMQLISSAEVIRRIELYHHGGRLKPLTPGQGRAARRGVRATRDSPFDRQPLTLHNAGMACQRFLQAMPAYPGGCSGRGIVVCGGGARYFPGAWVCIRMLRRLGCRLPIELWHLGRAELDPSMRGILAPLGVQCVDARQVRRTAPARILRGWELKPYSILHSRFREVLLLDADNVPVRNPEYLFNTPEYQATGAIFWPDRDPGSGPVPVQIWRSCGMRPPPEPEFESGQVLVDKRRCWRALTLTMWFNEHSDFYFRYLHGDKETFHLGFRKLRRPYSLVPKPLHPLEATFCQHDFRGRRLFQHRNGDKWKFLGRHRRVEDFWFEPECRGFIAELRQIWPGPAGGGKASSSS